MPLSRAGFTAVSLCGCTLLLTPLVRAQQAPKAQNDPDAGVSLIDTPTTLPGITPRGPIPIRDARPFHLIFLQFAPENPTVLGDGEKRFGVQLDVINNLLNPAIGANGARVTEDNEMQRLQLSWRQNIAKRTEASLVVPILARNGGILDGPISAYHRLLGISGDAKDNPIGRDNTPRGRSVLFYRTAAGQTVNAGTAFGLGDASLFVKRELSSGRRTAFSVRAGVKAPTGSKGKYLGSGGFDAGLMLDSRFALSRRLFLYGSAGVVAMGKDSRLPGQERHMAQGSLALEWSRKRSSLVAQLDANSRVVTTGNAFADRTPVTVTLGYKREMSRGRTLFAAFSENGDYHNYKIPGLGNIGPDTTFSFGMDWRR